MNDDKTKFYELLVFIISTIIFFATFTVPIRSGKLQAISGVLSFGLGGVLLSDFYRKYKGKDSKKNNDEDNEDKWKFNRKS